jgi:hypothetical protein
MNMNKSYKYPVGVVAFQIDSPFTGNSSLQNIYLSGKLYKETSLLVPIRYESDLFKEKNSQYAFRFKADWFEHIFFKNLDFNNINPTHIDKQNLDTFVDSFKYFSDNMFSSVLFKATSSNQLNSFKKFCSLYELDMFKLSVYGTVEKGVYELSLSSLRDAFLKNGIDKLELANLTK